MEYRTLTGQEYNLVFRGKTVEVTMPANGKGIVADITTDKLGKMTKDLGGVLIAPGDVGVVAKKIIGFSEEANGRKSK